MIEVLRWSDGCGVIDDSGEFRLGANRHGGPDTRAVVSEVADTDVITGTKEKVLSAARDAAADYRPAFMLFSAGPCGAMIGTDLGEIAEAFQKESGIPCGVSELTGQKTYDVGVAKTIEGMARLLTEESPVQQGTVNLLGSTTLDWSEDDLADVRNWIEQQGFRVIAQPGARVTASEIRQMAKAEWNLVTSAAGLAAARYLEQRFGTPYTAAAPFGEANCRSIMGRKAPEAPQDARVTTLIIGEQFTANAVRAALEGLCPGETARVHTFYQLDKSCARRGDRKLKGEYEAREILTSGMFERVIADPLLRPFAGDGVKWIDLPHRAMHTYGTCEPLALFGAKCDKWLEKNL